MIRSYVANPQSIILAVTGANQDFATSEPIKLAREVDPEGMRLFPGITDYSLMKMQGFF